MDEGASQGPYSDLGRELQARDAGRGDLKLTLQHCLSSRRSCPQLLLLLP